MTAETKTATSSEASARNGGRSILTTLALVGLLAATVDFSVPVLVTFIQNGSTSISPLIIISVDLIVAGVLATRWRWGVGISLFVGAMSLLIDLTPGYAQYSLIHPSVYGMFAAFVLHVALNLLIVITSGAALAQTIRKETPHSPRWLSAAITGAACLAIGALLVGATGQYSGSAAATATGTEVVHLTTTTFAPNIIALHKGDTLTVVDDASILHILNNGTWSASNQAQPGAEPGAPTINNVQLNNNTVVLGPFTTPGTYHIYCSVHPGMNLTVIVQ